MPDKLTTIREGLTAQQAEAFKRLLADRDVEVRSAPSGSVQGEWDLLAEKDVAGRAIRFLELADQPAREAGDESDDQSDDEEMILDDREWTRWPRCPVCDWPRVTRCRFCGTSGNSFPVADGAPDSEFAAVLLICETCDEPFEPEFLNHCDRCNEPFPDGIAFPKAAEVNFNNPRVYAAGGMLFMLTALLFAYWFFVMN